MSSNDPYPPLVIIAGPTASGKTALALGIADGRNCVIVNADSAQVYADLPILTAQPTVAEQARVPHRLFGMLDAAEAGSVASWAAAARSEIDAAHSAGKLPILVGGTGLYLRTLLDGIAPIPTIDSAVRDAVRALPVADAHAALLVEDPDMASRLSPRDTTRVQRALEVMRATGTSIAQWRQQREGGIAERVRLSAFVLLPPRETVFARCDRRFLEMLDGGAVPEVEALLARRLEPVLPAMRAIGVREIAAWLTGSLSRDAMIAAAQQATRNYAKRQFTWFGHQTPACWYRGSDMEYIVEKAIKETMFL